MIYIMENVKKKIVSKRKKSISMKKESVGNKQILESRRLIKEAKEKIKLEKKNIKNSKREEFKKTKFYKFLNKHFSFVFGDKDTYSFSEVLAITLFSLVIGAFSCFSIFTIISGGRNYFKLSGELSKFVEVYDTIVENYNGKIDKDELIDNAIDGMLSDIGDVYTSYVDKGNTEEFNQLVGGVYEGIGCTIQLREDGVNVVEIFEGSPAEKANLQVGDIILSVDGKDVSLMNVNEIANYIKKESSGKIAMVVLRNSKEEEITLIREEVETPVVNSVIYERNDKKVGYLSISIFTSVASKQFKTKLEDLEREGIDSLIIDVRNNNGGYLSTVTDIVSQILPKGKIIYQVEGQKDKDITKDKTSTYRDYPIAVLVNGASASASEILAAAIKESYDGYVVGTKTYGKGTVQQTKMLSDGSMIKYTVENWLTPDGNWINGEGIEPTHEIEIDEKYYENPIVENDSQLQSALELLSE